MKRALRKSPPSLYTYLWDTWTLQSDQPEVGVDWDQVVSEVRRKPRLACYHDEERRGMLLLHLVCALHPTPEAIRALLEANPAATSHVCAGTGLIPLHIAAGRNATTATLRILLKHDPKSIHTQDHNGQTAIHYACRQDVDKEVVHLLLQVEPLVVAGGGQLNNASGGALSRPYHRDTPSPLDILYNESGPSARDGYGQWTENQWLKINKLVLVSHYGTLSARNGQTRSFLHAALARNCPKEVLTVAVKIHGQHAAGMTDIFGNLPLHYAVGCFSSLTTSSSSNNNNASSLIVDDQEKDVISTLLTSFPQAAGIRDAKGRLPLHQVLKQQQRGDNNNAASEILRKLLTLYPLAVQLRDKETKLPPALIAATYEDDGSVETTYMLLREYPQIIPSL